MPSTGKVLGAIGALNTLIENFPMSILDLLKGDKVYTSAFDFMIDVLYACGVPTDKIIGYLLEEIYSITPNMEGGIENLKENIANMDFTESEESGFLKTLEDGLKIILNGLLASVYGCSSIPILPNKVMDYPNPYLFNEKGGVDLTWWEETVYPSKFEIPIKMIDPMGLLELTPTTSDGKAYYDIPGCDLYYKKKKKEETISTFSFIRTIKNIDNPIQIQINNNILYFLLKDPTIENIKIRFSYFKNDNIFEFTTTIKAGETISDKEFSLDSIAYIKDIKINNSFGGTLVGDNIWCFLEKNDNEIFKNISWGTSKNNIILGDSKQVNSEYEYELLSEIPENSKEARRLNHVPEIVNENDSDLIVVYYGMRPNELYKSNDMNAFIWYSIVRGSTATQIDKNMTMWDSRITAKENGMIRDDNTDWNNWYNSKKTTIDEFKYPNNDYLTNNSLLYPIIQLEKSRTNKYALNVSLPSQRYFKPKTREGAINGNSYRKFEFNSSIYKFNKDYIDNIKILKPKMLLTGFVNYMLGYAISTLKSIDINLTKKMIETKLSTAIKKIIEADDMEIEDCYTTFSNEEFDSMLEEMLYSRYTSTYYGGETNKLKKHDIESYIALLDSFNAITTREESITKINRLVTEVMTTSGCSDNTISYGLSATIDGNLLKKLLWAITMPIIESLFTPQVMLLIVINMSLMGIVKIEDFLNNDMSKIMNLIFNKILGLTKAIVKYVKDAILDLLMKLFLKEVTPLLIKYAGALTIEKLEYWLNLLTEALKCLPKLPRFSISLGKSYYKQPEFSNDIVNYADILYKGQLETPESSLPC